MLGPALPTPESQDVVELRAHLVVAREARIAACQNFKDRATKLLASVGAPPPTPRRATRYLADELIDSDSYDDADLLHRRVRVAAMQAKHARSAIHARFKDTTMMAIEDIADDLDDMKKLKSTGSSSDIRVHR